MVDPAVYPEKISVFSRILQAEGLPVSPNETSDACRILTVCPLEDRSHVKTALQTVFAKSREEQLIFDRVFDGFFLSEEAMRRQALEYMHAEQKQELARRQAEEDLQIQGRPIALREDLRIIYASMPEEDKLRLRQLKEKYKSNLERNPDLYSNFIHSVFTRALMEHQLQLEDAGIGAAETDPELGLMYRDISKFRDQEIPKAIAMIQSISRQINGEFSAKSKKAGHSRTPDFRKTIRKGLETGGHFYRICYKHKRKRRKHLVLLCDVSGSMMQFSEFALRFMQSMNQVSESSRVFLFSEDLFEASAFSLQNMDLFRSYVRDSGLYGRGTDLGTALTKLALQQPAVLGPSSTLLILSDTKTIDMTGALRALQEVKRLSGRLIWMNPIPEHKWPYLRSTQMIAAHCQMLPCSTLSALAAACRRLIL